MSFSVPYQPGPSWRPDEQDYRISDKAVMRIIQDNFGKRPIYFAVTCESNIGFEDFMRTEGMVSRLVHTRAESETQVDIMRLSSNLDSVYKYRSVTDPAIRKTEFMKRLFMNYGAAYADAGKYYAVHQDFDKAWSFGSQARSFIEDDLRLISFYIRYYAGLKSWDELDDYIESHVFTHPDGAAIYLRYLMQYLNSYDPQIALRYYEKAFRNYPDEDMVASYAVYFAEDYDLRAPVANLLKSLEDVLWYSVDDYLDYLGFSSR